MTGFESKSLLNGNGKSLAKQVSAVQSRETENSQCANCKQQDPSFVCLDFQTFVCQACGDVHREFGHKIASITHWEWSEEEVELIKEGGNKKAAQEWLAFWNPSEFPAPENSDPERIRVFIRKAYLIKCWQKQPDLKRKPRSSIVGAPKGPAAATGEVSAAAVQQPVTGGLTSGLPVSGALPVPSAFVFLQKDAACFCPDHDRTEKRPKREPTLRSCNGCKVQLQTNYDSFSHCPSCSAKEERCMICGTSCARGVDEAGLKSISRGSSREGTGSAETAAG